MKLPLPAHRKHPVILKVWGENACFTRPEMKVERVSYDVMTPSAARGILESILWKPSIRWHIHSIDVLKPIRWESVRRNEVSEVASQSLVVKAMNAGRGDLGIRIEDVRQQRAGLLLRDVAYLIHAGFELTEKAGSGESVVKFSEMFQRRARKGQCFGQPYLGCREFSAFFELIEAGNPLPEPIADDRDLGWMLHDIEVQGGEALPGFFRAKLEAGRLAVPAHDDPEVRR